MKALWGALLAGFVAMNIYALVAGGLSELADYLRNLGPWGLVATMDAGIALTIGVLWMWRDARAKGVAPLPYAVLTAATGSLGLLVYLVRHDGSLRHHDQVAGDRSSTRVEAA